MIKSRTHIKLLRRLGIALIALPEPFTTPFGVALVLVSRYLSKRREASQNKRLRETVQYYLAHTKSFSSHADGKSIAPGPVKLLSPGKEHAILGQIIGSRSFEANPAPSVCQSWRDMQNDTIHHTRDTQSLSGRYKAGDNFKVESGWTNTSSRAEKVIHHTINWESLSLRYESQGNVLAYSNWACTSGAIEGVVQHSVNMGLLSQRYKTGSIGQVQVKYHTLNTALLLQRYGATMYTMALQNPLK